MKRSLLTTSFVLVLMCACQAQDSRAPASPSEAAPVCVAPDPAALPQEKPLGGLSLDEILAKLRQRTSGMRSYQADIHYLFIQDPELLDSRTLRKGIIYYQRGDGRSRLRVNFNTIQQDDAPQRERIEQFSFDGVWLTKIDHELKTVDLYQQAEENNPQDVFEYISHNFPIVGFSSTETLRGQFDIGITDQPTDPNKPIRLHLKVKPDSVYKDDYRDIDFSIDSRTWLPLRVVARSTEGDIYDIQFVKAAVNKNLENSVFVIETPESFSKNRHPLKKDRERKK
jgi:outer membrane lipoprotein-sorting protein